MEETKNENQNNIYPVPYSHNNPCGRQRLGAYSGGTGEPNNPYQIATTGDLLALAADTNDYGKCFILTADVNIGGQVFATAIIAADTVAGSNFEGTAFTGTFDGNGHKITHFTINGGSNWYLGLFGRIYGGSVKNLGLENCAVSGYAPVGCLVGQNVTASISNCYSTGAVSGMSCVGCLVGQNVAASISNCYSTGAVSVTSDFVSSNIGGLVGGNSSGSISNCYSTGTVSGSSNSYYVGGLVGGDSDGSISNCYSIGPVSGWDYVGGLVGSGESELSNRFILGQRCFGANFKCRWRRKNNY